MEIILKQDVAKLGNAGDVVKVKNGYASNYLVPQGYATLATASALKQHTETQKQRAFKEAKIKLSADELAQKLSGISLTIATKVGSTGKIYGSVNTLQLADALKHKGFDVDRKQITIDEEQVKEVGKYNAELKLHRDVKVKIEFEVVAEE
ncbi:50S ribosomal protein L9 [Bacteroidia bacterium]|nr:50S ribosomal protein L9 [Bacteroidia bacterium]